MRVDPDLTRLEAAVSAFRDTVETGATKPLWLARCFGFHRKPIRVQVLRIRDGCGHCCDYGGGSHVAA